MAEHSPSAVLDTVVYDDRRVAWFLWATLIWGVVGLLAGVYIALQLSGMGTLWGPAWLNQGLTGFGRLRPLHTNAVIFAFTGNAIFAGVYYSCQRLLKARLWSDKLTLFHFWSWQAIIVAAAVTLPLGISTSKEYAELEWPIDILITLSWVAFSANVVGTIFVRRERHLYVAIWFYLATIIGIAMLHVVNSLAVPVSPTKSYSLFAGQQDALVQWWYGHNAVAFFLTTPILGLMYYFLPKAAERPVYSYRLSILHFWSLVFIYIWAGPHHLLHSALPEWAQTLGVVFSIMLLAPSWGGMINGLLTLRGAFDKVRESPVLKFFVAAITFYGMSTFEGPLLSLRSVNALSHNTDWTIGHVHSGALGWVGFMCFGMAYWLLPRLYRTTLHSTGQANAHFWMATIGIVLYVIAMWGAGIQQGMMWFEFTSEGTLAHQDWMSILTHTKAFYAVRAIGGALYLLGAILCLYNLFRTACSGKVVDTVVQVAPLPRETEPADVAIAAAAAVPGAGAKTNAIHDLIERWPFLMICLTALALVIGGAMEIIPNMMQGAAEKPLASVKPYTPLELAGRDIYISEGCISCHTQMVRTLRAESLRYYESELGQPAYTRAGEGVYDRPFLWGSKRTGPDLAREGLAGKNADWQWRHLLEPESKSPGSLMPAYPHLLTQRIDHQQVQASIRALARTPLIATPYGIEQTESERLARTQALAILAQIPEDMLGGQSREQAADSRLVALVAYLLRLGTDIKGSKQP